MNKEILHIRNMVCDRCKMSVTAILSRLDIPFESVGLGEVVLVRPVDEKEKTLLKNKFSEVGFEMIDDRSEQMVNRIKSLIIEEVYQSETFPGKKCEEACASF